MANYLNQTLCTLIACFLCLSVGIIMTWPSCTFRNFASAHSSLHRQMTEAELALLGSLSSFGALISTPIAGYTLDIIGRKRIMIASALAQVIAWAMIASSNRVEVILTAVFVTGVGGCSFLIVPIYVTEICQDSIRGAMAAVTMVFYAIGMLFSYLLGGYLPYHTMVYVCLASTVLGVCMLTFVRETALFFLKKGMEKEAAMSMGFYRNSKTDSKVVLEELEAIRRTLNPDIENEDAPTVPEQEKLNPVEKVQEPKTKLSVWQFFKKSPSTRRAAFVTLVLMTASLFQGVVVLQVYAEPLFEEAVPSISPTTCSVILALVTVVVGLVGAYLTEVAGRRPLLIYGSIASGLCCVVLATLLQFHWAPHWVTALFIYLFTVTYTLGGGTVPYVLAPEVFLPEVKSVLTMIVIEWIWFCNFIILFIFNPLVSAIGLGSVFYLFAAVCFFTAVATFFYLPETKGLTVDVIQTKFVKKSPKH